VSTSALKGNEFRLAVIHLHLVPKLRMCGTIPPLPHTSSWCIFSLSTGTPFTFIYASNTEILNVFQPLQNQMSRTKTFKTTQISVLWHLCLAETNVPVANSPVIPGPTKNRTIKVLTQDKITVSVLGTFSNFQSFL